MRITLNRTEFATALNWASKGISKRPALPILAAMRLEVGGGRLTLSAFDYDVSATAHVTGAGALPDTTAEPGSILVNGRALVAIVKAAPKGKTVRVDLTRVNTPATEATDDTPARAASSALIVRCQGSESRLAAMPEDDYPQLPELPAAAGVVASDAFKRSAGRIAPLAGTDDTLPVLTTVRLEMSADVLTLAATDRYRLGVDEIEWTAGEFADAAGNGYAVQVPARVLADFAKATGKGGKVTIHYAPTIERDADTDTDYRPAFGALSDDSRTITFRSEFGQYGQFPKYRALMPNTADFAALVNSDSLAGAVKRVAVTAERNTPIRLTFGPELGHVTIAAGSDEEASSSERVDVAFDGADSMTVGYNPAYLLSILAGVDGDAWMSWNAPAKPLVISSADSADPYRGLIMPIRLGG